MNIEKRYTEIIEKLKLGHRYLTPITKDEIQELKEKLDLGLDSYNKSLIMRIICILDNTSSTFPELEETLLNLLGDKKLNMDVYLLNAVRKHIIAGNHKLGNRLSLDLLNQLKSLLTHKDPEVKEWTLRTIEECGGQAIFLRKEINLARPKGIVINKHKIAARQIVDMLESKWSRIENR